MPDNSKDELLAKFLDVLRRQPPPPLVSSLKILPEQAREPRLKPPQEPEPQEKIASESLHDTAEQLAQLEEWKKHVATTTDIQSLKTEFVTKLSRNQKWIIGGIIAVTGLLFSVLIAAIVFLFNLLNFMKSLFPS